MSALYTWPVVMDPSIRLCVCAHVCRLVREMERERCTGRERENNYNNYTYAYRIIKSHRTGGILGVGLVWAMNITVLCPVYHCPVYHCPPG